MYKKLLTNIYFWIGITIGAIAGNLIGQWLMTQGVLISLIAVIGCVLLLMFSYWLLMPVLHNPIDEVFEWTRPK